MFQGLRQIALIGAALLLAATGDAWSAPAYDENTERLVAPSVVLQGELAVHDPPGTAAAGRGGRR